MFTHIIVGKGWRGADGLEQEGDEMLDELFGD